MKKVFLLSLILLLFSTVLVSSLRAEDTTTTLQETTTTIAIDTTTSLVNPATPVQPLSFVGRILARLRVILTQDPIKKAELTLQLTQDDLLKLDRSNLNTEALKKALENYNQAIDRLKTRLENLKTISNNPNIDTLLNRLTDLEIRHQEVFNKLLTNSTTTEPLLERVRNRIRQDIIPLHLRFENQEEFMNRLQEGLKNLQATSTPIGEFRQLRIMETLREQLQQMNVNNLATSTQEQFQQLTERLTNQIQQRTETLEKQGFSSSSINQILNATPKPTFRNLPQTPPPNSSRGK